MKDTLKDKNIILSKYNDLADLRNRLLENDFSISAEDHLAVDFALDLIEHLKLLETKRHFKDSFELRQFLVNISEDFNNEDIEDKDFTKIIDNELAQINKHILDNGISFFKGYEITCDFDE